MILKAGQLSLHHPMIVHGSPQTKAMKEELDLLFKAI